MTNTLTKAGALVALFSCIFMASAPAAAQTVTRTNLTVDRIFTESIAGGGFFPSQDISADCLWGLIYLDLSTQAGRGQLALLMQAKAMGLKVHMVSAVKGTPGYAAGTCLANALHIQ